MKFSELKNKVNAYKIRKNSTWGAAVKQYAIDTLSDCDWHSDNDDITSVKQVINHCDAANMTLSDLAHDLSYGGCYLIYDDDIAKCCCTAQAYQRAHYKDGTLKDGPNSQESWLDVQTKAVYQAYCFINRVLHA